MDGGVDDDKCDYEAHPKGTHPINTPSEERVLPERRQVVEGYEQGARKSNCGDASYGQARTKSQEPSTR